MKILGYGRIIKSNIKGKERKYNHSCTREVSRNSRVCTRSDKKVMILAAEIILLIHELQSTIW
jgi:hypothetical protein